MKRRSVFAAMKEEVWPHVDFSAPATERRKSALALAIVFGAAACLLGIALPWLTDGAADWSKAAWVAGTGMALAIGLNVPGLGRVLFGALMGVGGLVGYLVNVILLGVMFYLFITPAALILKARSKDLLDRRRPKDSMPAGSAWHDHAAPAPKSQYHHLS